jgi:hypothetical protein
LLLLRETPQNGGYMVAAHARGAVVLVGYAVVLFARARRVMREEP